MFPGEVRPSNEPLALEALKNFDDVVVGGALVPEHVETRGLFSPERPGVSQVKYFNVQCILNEW